MLASRMVFLMKVKNEELYININFFKVVRLVRLVVELNASHMVKNPQTMLFYNYKQK